MHANAMKKGEVEGWREEVIVVRLLYEANRKGVKGVSATRYSIGA